jgi:hypothetical protein
MTSFIRTIENVKIGIDWIEQHGRRPLVDPLRRNAPTLFLLGKVDSNTQPKVDEQMSGIATHPNIAIAIANTAPKILTINPFLNNDLIHITLFSESASSLH